MIAEASIAPPEPLEGPERLRRCLAVGVAQAGDGPDARAELRLDPATSDADVGRALVQVLDAVEVASLALTEGGAAEEGREVAPVVAADSSFLGRLGGEGADAMGVDEVSDVSTLVAVLRAGRLEQRRAALLRLAEELSQGGRASAAKKEAVAALEASRDVELAYERSLVHAQLPGAAGRAARAEQEQWQRLVDRILPTIRAFWDAEITDEPVAELSGEERVRLLMRAPDLPDEAAAHLAAVIEGSAGNVTTEARLDLLSSLRHSADERLVAALITVMETAPAELALEAVRALSRVRDPRVRPALLAAYDRSVIDPNRALLAGALAAVGDHRGLDYVKDLLASEDHATRLAALEAMETLGASEDCERISGFLADESPAVVAQAVRTLARMGDARALPALAEMRGGAASSALRAEAEDAILAIQARLVLKGEGEDVEVSLPEPAPEAPLLSIPAMKRFRAYMLYAAGRTWILLGAFGRGVDRLERAAATRAGWVTPLLAIGLACTRRRRFAQALSVFRRAIDVGRRRVERNPVAISALAHTFLERSEELEQEGRREIARGLIAEALDLDLRRAPSALRFELERRRRTLRRQAP